MRSRSLRCARSARSSSEPSARSGSNRAGSARSRGEKAPFAVPFLRNPSFVGREDDLTRLHTLLQKGGAVGVRPAALTGMGGIGKTQLAVEYAYRYAPSYPGGVYWLEAAGDDWKPALAALAVKLDLEAKNAPEGERQLRLVAAL